MLQPFGEKAYDFAFRHPSQDARLNILQGAVRSGKTWALHPKTIQLCAYPVGGLKLITGASKSSIFDNVLSDLFNIVGAKHYHYNRQSGELRLFNSRWSVLGAKDDGSEKFLRGKTVGVCVSDELTMMPRNFFQMLLSRMSPAGARFYASTNPDNPQHWLKTEYLDRTELYDSGDLWSEHFVMDDNPNLSEEYKDSVKRLYTGFFYKRFILGLWVAAEGAIYSHVWNDSVLYNPSEEPLGLRNQGGHKRRYISVDFGTVNACAYLDWYDDGTHLWLAREYYWDSAKEYRQKTNGEYADDMVKFIGTNNRGAQIIIDPSAASLKIEFQKRGLWMIDAKNDVVNGIRTTASAIGSGLIRVNRECKATCKQMPGYVWDEKAALRGDEKPIKSNDHAPDAFRYLCETVINPWRIQEATKSSVINVQ